MTRALTVSVAGLGRAGSALLRECLDAPSVRVIGAWNRTERDLGAQGVELGARLAWGGAGPPAQHLGAEIVLLAVADDSVQAVCASLSAPPTTCVLHLSGAADVSLLDGLRAGVPGCWHPLQAFSSGGRRSGVPPYAVALQGPPAAVRCGRALADALGHPAVELAANGRAAYHAAAVLASNCLVALEASALRVMRSAGVSEAEGWQLLWPLVSGTLANLEDGPRPSALTGPIARGDADTVRRNLAAIATDEKATDTYRALGAEAVDLAAEAGVEFGRLAAIRQMIACAAEGSD